MHSVLLAHTRPHICVYRLSACYGLARVVEKLDRRSRRRGQRFRLSDNLRFGIVAGRRGHAHRDAKLRPRNHQGVAHVVSVTHEGQFQPGQHPEFLPQGVEIGQSLAGVKEVGERVHDGN